jgi:uncharacterized membrane-anchored protein YitT (DUF2179 family)
MKFQKILAIVAVILGIGFIILSVVYFSTPAGMLPGYLPGHIIASTTIHYKHAIGSLLLALVLFAFAWFQTGKKSA